LLDIYGAGEEAIPGASSAVISAAIEKLGVESIFEPNLMKAVEAAVSKCGSGDIILTLGAGDVFHGALLAQLLEGLSLNDALMRANVVAALSCKGLDGQSAIPTKDQLNTYLKGAK